MTTHRPRIDVAPVDYGDLCAVARFADRSRYLHSDVYISACISNNR